MATTKSVWASSTNASIATVTIGNVLQASHVSSLTVQTSNTNFVVSGTGNSSRTITYPAGDVNGSVSTTLTSYVKWTNNNYSNRPECTFTVKMPLNKTSFTGITQSVTEMWAGATAQTVTLTPNFSTTAAPYSKNVEITPSDTAVIDSKSAFDFTGATSFSVKSTTASNISGSVTCTLDTYSTTTSASSRVRLYRNTLIVKNPANGVSLTAQTAYVLDGGSVTFSTAPSVTAASGVPYSSAVTASQTSAVTGITWSVDSNNKLKASITAGTSNNTFGSCKASITAATNGLAATSTNSVTAYVINKNNLTKTCSVNPGDTVMITPSSNITLSSVNVGSTGLTASVSGSNLTITAASGSTNTAAGAKTITVTACGTTFDVTVTVTNISVDIA